MMLINGHPYMRSLNPPLHFSQDKNEIDKGLHFFSSYFGFKGCIGGNCNTMRQPKIE